MHVLVVYFSIFYTFSFKIYIVYSLSSKLLYFLSKERVYEIQKFNVSLFQNQYFNILVEYLSLGLVLNLNPVLI
jgi:hypothetical protein